MLSKVSFTFYLFCMKKNIIYNTLNTPGEVNTRPWVIMDSNSGRCVTGEKMFQLWHFLKAVQPLNRV